MVYIALARKYRPRNFREVRGQRHTTKALINALDFDRLHHAYLFSGTRGVGKTTLARIFANCLNCEVKISSSPCGNCSACEGVLRGNYPDLYEVDAASRTGVDDMRKLLENVHYSPSVGRFKVYIIDEVHMLSTASFNALLKTLEEPPSHVRFIFATTDPKKVPLTVLSRCLQFHLRNIEPKVVHDQLITILTQESIEFDEESLQLLARAAQGSMRDALSLTDQAIAHGGGSLKIDQVANMLGTVRTDEVLEILHLIGQGDRIATLELITELSRQAVSFIDLLENLQRTIHELALAQITGQCEIKQMQPLLGKFSAEWLQVAYQILILGMRDLKYAPDHKTGFEMTLIRLLDFEPVADSAKDPTSGVHTSPVKNTESDQSKYTVAERTEPFCSSDELSTREISQTKHAPHNRLKDARTSDRKTYQESSAERNQDTGTKSFTEVDKEVLLQDPFVTSLIENFDAQIIDIKHA